MADVQDIGLALYELWRTFTNFAVNQLSIICILTQLPYMIKLLNIIHIFHRDLLFFQLVLHLLKH